MRHHNQIMARLLFFCVLLSVGNCYTTNKQAMVRTNTLAEDNVVVSMKEVSKIRALSSLSRVMKLQMRQVMRKGPGTDLYDICHHTAELPTPIPKAPPTGVTKWKLRLKELLGDDFWKGIGILYWLFTTGMTLAIASIGIETAMMDQEGSSSVFTPSNVQCYEPLKNVLMWVQTVNVETYDDPCTQTDYEPCTEYSPLRTLAFCIMNDMNTVIERQRNANIQMSILAATQIMLGHVATHAAVDDSAQSIQKDLDEDGEEDDSVELQTVNFACDIETAIDRIKEAFEKRSAELAALPIS
jgi:hypothetical protein